MNDQKLTEQELIDGVTRLMLHYPNMSLDRYRDVRVLYGLSDPDAIEAQLRHGARGWKKYITALKYGYTHSQIMRADTLQFPLEWLDQDTLPHIEEMLEFCEREKEVLDADNYWVAKTKYYTLCIRSGFSHSEFMSAYEKGSEFLQNVSALVAFMRPASKMVGLTCQKLIKLMDGKDEEELYHLQQNVAANTPEQRAFLRQELATIS